VRETSISRLSAIVGSAGEEGGEGVSKDDQYLSVPAAKEAHMVADAQLAFFASAVSEQH
jgi:hypothetical protein